jgi:hypothetical protein
VSFPAGRLKELLGMLKGTQPRDIYTIVLFNKIKNKKKEDKSK